MGCNYILSLIIGASIPQVSEATHTGITITIAMIFWIPSLFVRFLSRHTSILTL